MNERAQDMVNFWDTCTHYAETADTAERGIRISYPDDLIQLAERYGEEAKIICSDISTLEEWFRSNDHDLMRKAAVVIDAVSTNVVIRSFDSVFSDSEWLDDIPEQDNRRSTHHTPTEQVFMNMVKQSAQELQNLHQYIRSGGHLEEPGLEVLQKQAQARLNALYEELACEGDGDRDIVSSKRLQQVCFRATERVPLISAQTGKPSHDKRTNTPRERNAQSKRASSWQNEVLNAQFVTDHPDVLGQIHSLTDREVQALYLYFERLSYCDAEEVPEDLSGWEESDHRRELARLLGYVDPNSLDVYGQEELQPNACKMVNRLLNRIRGHISRFRMQFQ